MVEYLDDIERKTRRRTKEKMKKEVAEDIADVAEDAFDRVEDVFKRKAIEQKIKKGIVRRIVELILFFGLALLIVNFVLVNIWLIKTLITSLFNLR